MKKGGDGLLKMILIRDPFLGKPIEDEQFIIDLINFNSKNALAMKNPDAYGIDVIIVDKSDENKILAFIEVEGTNERFWNYTPKPTWPSGLMTIPIRKIKFFIKKHKIIEEFLLKNRTIEKDDLFNLFNLNDNDSFKFEAISGPPRFWIKMSYSGKYFCICNKNDIVNRINTIESDSGYKRNIWQNQFVTNSFGQIRSDQSFVVVGKLNDESNLFFSNFVTSENKLSKEFFDYIERESDINFKNIR